MDHNVGRQDGVGAVQNHWIKYEWVFFFLGKGSETVCAGSGSASAEQRAESLAYRQSINQRSQSQRQRTWGEEGGQPGEREVH